MPNNLFIISGPSGAGKDAVINGLKKILPISQLITTVSRTMRAGERQGKPYYFISKNEYKKQIKQGKFFEYDQHYGNYYGLTNKEINKINRKGEKKIYYWQAEYHGVITAKKKMPKITTIFLYSPLEILIKRMKQREKNIDPKIFKQRIHDIKEWFKHQAIYNYAVENKQGELDKTIEKVAKIIKTNTAVGCWQNPIIIIILFQH